jgi:alkanesulfonate monooxygenase SsuD/methylene tetrahydromethanopterin reductase-like flavin-dependent oxidoreductase (luciferase family)
MMTTTGSGPAAVTGAAGLVAPNRSVAAAPVGVGFTPFEHRLDVIERVAAHAELRGLSFVSVAEAMTLAAPIVLARLAERTRHIGLSTGVLSVWSRTPATMALTAAQLQRQSAGRFVLGLGASTPPIVEGFHGQSWQTPLDRLEQTCVAVRALLRGERLPAAAQGGRPLQLGCPPEIPVPIALAAITAPSIRLVGALADQWLPFLLPMAGLDAGRDLIAAAAADHRRSTLPTVTAAVPVALAPDQEGAARIAARWLFTYATRMGPVYPRVLRAHGYHRELDALLEANSDPRHPVLPSQATRLAEDVLMFGTYNDAPELCRRWQAHTDAIALVTPFGVAAEDLMATIDAVTSGSAAACNPAEQAPVLVTR